MRRVLGVFVFVMGLGLGLWLAYVFLIERGEASRANNPMPALVTSAAFLFVGYKWMRGKTAK